VSDPKAPEIPASKAPEIPASKAPEIPASKAPEIHCRAINKTFVTRSGTVHAIADTDLKLTPGSLTALVGPSGCGKSTLLRIIAGLEQHDPGGAVTIDGADPLTMRKRGEISIAFQDASLLPWRTTESNVALAQKLARQKVDHTKIAELLELVGLAGFEKARPAQLSGGMRQRAAIARCLATSPRINPPSSQSRAAADLG
jgi:NitT/TauT family transport system ATP-binding protein